MNKKELNKYIKKILCKDVFFNIEIIDKNVYFYLYGLDNREVCFMEIPYKNRTEKKEIYKAILTLINEFDFSFRVTFTKTEDIYKFLEVI